MLNQKLLEEEIVKIIGRRYNEAAAVYKAVLDCNNICEDNILKNLKTSKVLISDGDLIISEKSNVNEYLKYFLAAKLLGRTTDKIYFIIVSREFVKNHRISIFLKDPGSRRLFNMISMSKAIEDKDITVYSLLCVNRIKSCLIELQKIGLISQQCVGDYTNYKMEHKWFVDFEYTSSSMLYILQDEMLRKFREMEKYTEGCEYYNVLMSEIINLSIDHCIFASR